MVLVEKSQLTQQNRRSSKRFLFFSTAIDGGYSGWKETTKCSATCGGGKKTLTRTCTNPPPSNGGKDCNRLGPATKDVSCNEQECRKLTLCHQLPNIFFRYSSREPIEIDSRSYLPLFTHVPCPDLNVPIITSVFFGRRSRINFWRIEFSLDGV